MNEQDFTRIIEEKTKNLEIPESVSPEEMKKRLDLAYADKNDKSKGDVSKIKTFNRGIRYATAAACIALCLVGTFGVARLINTREVRQDTAAIADNDYAEEDVEMTAEDAGGADVAESADDNDGFKNDLAYHTGLVSPKNYDEYYNDIKSAYDKYYDSISTVVSEKESYRTEQNVDAVESAAADTGGEESAKDLNSFNSMADSVAGNVAMTEEAVDDHSETNRQEENVDEGDIIKTDGRYIYKAVSSFNTKTGGYDSRLIIVKVDDGKLEKLSDTFLCKGVDYEEHYYMYLDELYLIGDRIVIMYTGYDHSSAESNTIIEIYDVSDRKEPKKIKTHSQSGEYLSSRISDGYLYTVSNFNDMDFTEKEPYRNYIPRVNDSIMPCSKIFYNENSMVDSSKVITSIKIDEPKKFADSVTIPGWSANVYVSENAMYFYETTNKGFYDEITKTKITKLYYDKGSFSVGESTVVAGYLYGPFAINEYDNHLRIVATIPANNFSVLRNSLEDVAIAEGNTVDKDVNALYILDDKMELTGKISGIAPGERIYSARFMGDIGYFVTYRNMDPLFAVDLKDPENPEIIGSLKIPGFSSYMHPYDKNLLLGIGVETEPETGQTLGIKLSMFDTGKPSDIEEIDKYIIERGDYSTALNDYKAVMIDPEKNIFGFVYAGHSVNSYDYWYSTFTYDDERGFVETARYKLPDDWYDINAVRGVYIGDYFYLAAETFIKSYEIGSEDLIDSVRF